MASLVIDTNNLVNHLESFGFTRKQAEGVTEALHKLDTSALATKTDVERLENNLDLKINKLEGKIEKLGIELKSKIEIEIKESRFQTLKWMLAMLSSQGAIFAGIVVTVLKIMH